MANLYITGGEEDRPMGGFRDGENFAGTGDTTKRGQIARSRGDMKALKPHII